MFKLHFISEERLESLVEKERHDAFIAGLRKGEENAIRNIQNGGQIRMTKKGPRVFPKELVERLIRERQEEVDLSAFVCTHGHTFQPGDTGDCYEHIYGKRKAAKK